MPFGFTNQQLLIGGAAVVGGIFILPMFFGGGSGGGITGSRGTRIVMLNDRKNPALQRQPRTASPNIDSPLIQVGYTGAGHRNGGGSAGTGAMNGKVGNFMESQKIQNERRRKFIQAGRTQSQRQNRQIERLNKQVFGKSKAPPAPKRENPMRMRTSKGKAQSDRTG